MLISILHAYLHWRFPFDTKKPIGYVIAVILQYISSRFGLMFAATLIGFGIGTYLFTLTLVNDVKCCLKTVHKSAKTKDRRVTLMHFSNFFQFYSDARQLNKFQVINECWIQISNNCCFVFVFFRLNHDFMKVFKPILLVNFTMGLISICCTMLIIEMELVQFIFLWTADIWLDLSQNLTINSKILFCFHQFQSKPEMDLVPLVLAFVDTFNYYSIVFVVCEICQQMSNAFEEIHKRFAQFDWYSFPNEIKQMLPKILIMLQRPVEFKCFGSFSSSRKSFKKASACSNTTDVYVV